MSRLNITITVLALMAFAPVALKAGDNAPVLDAWYPALFEVDGEKLEELLAENAEIHLDDLGITQSKDEFLESLEEWADSVEGAQFSWKLDPDAPLNDTTATALVCYRFPENQLLTREVFTFSGAMVLSSHQTTAGESCDGF